MPILLFLNIKGGVAKTTTAVAVAETLASMGHGVLLIDADHQCASSELLLGEQRFVSADHHHSTLHDLLAAMLDEEFDAEQIASFVAPDASNVESVRPLLSTIPCSFRINDFPTNMAKAKKGYDPDRFQAAWRSRGKVLRRWLLDMYHYTIVDCPPSLALQVKFFLRICDAYVIPSVPDRISVRGARWLGERLEKGGFKARALGLAWTLYRDQNERHRAMVGMVGKQAGKTGQFANLPEPFRTIVPNATAIVRAGESEQRVATVAAKYTPPFAKVFEGLAVEIIARLGPIASDRRRAARRRPAEQ